MYVLIPLVSSIKTLFFIWSMASVDSDKVKWEACFIHVLFLQRKLHWDSIVQQKCSHMYTLHMAELREWRWWVLEIRRMYVRMYTRQDLISTFYAMLAESWRLNQVGVHLVPFTRRNPSNDGRRVIFAILSLWVFIYVWVNNIDDSNTMMEGVVALAFMQCKRKVILRLQHHYFPALWKPVQKNIKWVCKTWR